jgi:iron(III) transport system ATP-binding protein
LHTVLKVTLPLVMPGCWERRSSGTLRIDGRTMYSLAERRNIPSEKRGVSMVVQSYAVWPHMTVFDNIA